MIARASTRVAAFVTLALLAGGCNGASVAEPSALAEAGGALRLVAFDPATLVRLGIRVEPAGTVGPAHTIRVTGTLDYDLDRYAEVGALLPGRVSSVMARVGDHVRKGQVLATLVVPSIADAQAGYLSAKAAAAAARKNRDREAALLGRELTTARESEVASSDAVKAQADLSAAEARLRALRVDLPDSDTTVVGAGTYKLVSPIDGVIVHREAVLGAFLEPNKTAFAVADLSELRATLEIFEADLPYVSEGVAVDLTIDAFPGKVYRGRVALLEPQVGSSTRSVRARVVVPNAAGELRPGLFVRAAIALPSELLASSLLVPAAAVQPLGEEDVVFVERTPGAYEVRPVNLTRRTSDVVDIAHGVARGENIVVAGAFLLRGEVTRQ